MCNTKDKSCETNCCIIIKGPYILVQQHKSVHGISYEFLIISHQFLSIGGFLYLYSDTFFLSFLCWFLYFWYQFCNMTTLEYFSSEYFLECSTEICPLSSGFNITSSLRECFLFLQPRGRKNIKSNNIFPAP